MKGLAALDAITPSEQSGWRFDKRSILELFPVVSSYAGAAQHPGHHAEGDVAIHTWMVLDALANNHEFRGLTADVRAVMFAACLLHDVAKPLTTADDGDGKITARGHSARGAMLSRRLLWDLGVPFAQRELICGLVRFHQAPFFLLEESDHAAERRALRIAEACRCDWLRLLAWADATGRRCSDQQRLLDNVALFGELTAELGVGSSPFAFDDDHSRFRYFRDERRTRHDAAFDDTRAQVTVLVGFPAAGKDHWCAANAGGAEVVSLDAIRATHGMSHEGSQSRVTDLAYQQMKSALRARRSVVWNATNLVRDLRSQIVDVADAYHARVRMVVVEASPEALRDRNRSRTRPVPEAVFVRMASRWDVPDRSEAHTVDVVVSDG